MPTIHGRDSWETIEEHSTYHWLFCTPGQPPRQGYNRMSLSVGCREAEELVANNFPISATAARTVILSAAKNLAWVAIRPRFFAVHQNDD